MKPPKIPGCGNGDDAQWRSSGPARLRMLLAACSPAMAAGGTAQGPPAQPSLVHPLEMCLPAGQAKPTMVLVHGAWADASSWSGEVSTLQAAGYDVRAIANPLQDLTTDAQYIADYLKTIHGPVVLAGHSYGGVVITNAAAGLPSVKALVYVDASAPAPGETNGQLSGAGSILNNPPPDQLFFTTNYPGAPAGASELYLKENIFLRYFASGLPRAEAGRLWASQRGASTAAFGTPSQAVAWKAIPSWYFISTGDQIHHGLLRTQDGPPRTLPHHRVPRRLPPDPDFPPQRGHRSHRLRDLLPPLATPPGPPGACLSKRPYVKERS